MHLSKKKAGAITMSQITNKKTKGDMVIGEQDRYGE
jgi:hypothetical protein